MKTGYTDRPILNLNEDLFGLNKYVDGLTEFISVCSTPMTIAIQGDWGTGKTSIMNMIRENIEDKCLCTWFNTWEYSQFNMSDGLAIALLKSMVETLNIDQKNNIINHSLKIIANGLKTSALMAIDMTAGGKAADTVEKAIQGFSSNDDFDFFNSIKILRQEFQNQIDKALEQSGKDRVVMFVDDLDRLNPEKAVELLEVLKNFLDCENCIFILAIDYKVVYKGVQLKYNNVLDDEKGKAFFEKIIQLPFKVPVVQYNLYNYIKQSMQNIGYSNEIDTNLCVEIINNSIGKNPRAIKRLLNSAFLLKKIQGSEAASAENETIMFAILCLQLSFEEVYNFLVTNIGDFNTSEELNKLISQDFYLNKEAGKSLAEDLLIDKNDNLIRVIKLMKSIISTIDSENPSFPSEEKISNFINLVGISTITSAYTSDEENISIENEFRWKNRELCKAIKDKIEKIYKDIDVKVYQPRKNHEYWKRQNACVYHHFEVNNLILDIELQIFTNLDTKVSNMNIKIACYNANDENMAYLKTILEDNKEYLGKYSRNEIDNSYTRFIAELNDCGFDEIVDMGAKEAKNAIDKIKAIIERTGRQ